MAIITFWWETKIFPWFCFLMKRSIVGERIIINPPNNIPKIILFIPIILFPIIIEFVHKNIDAEKTYKEDIIKVNCKSRLTFLLRYLSVKIDREKRKEPTHNPKMLSSIPSHLKIIAINPVEITQSGQKANDFKGKKIKAMTDASRTFLFVLFVL